MKEEIQEKLNVRFISLVEYHEWLANVVPVSKKEKTFRFCLGSRNLNKANLKG